MTQRTVLAILAHPDDAEFLCAGTLALLAREHHWNIHIATMTPGDCGSAEHSAEEISRIRRQEASASAAILQGDYHCLEERDLLVRYDSMALQKVTRLIRQVDPEVIITHSPADYHLDHEMTSQLVRGASFAAAVPLFDQGNSRATNHIATLYYCDPIEGKNIFGEPVAPQFCIDISSVIDIKAQMLAAHASQRQWLMKHHGVDNYIETMKAWSAHRGQERGVAFAEGFRQHLGHSYPQQNLLGQILGTV